MTGQEDLTAELESRRDQEGLGEQGEPDSHLSRRTALRGAAAAGIAATALAATATPALAAARPSRPAKAAAAHPAEDEKGEAIVAHVRNARTGEIDVFRGTSQTRLHDPALAALLLRAGR
jgi:hypothetical protein